MSGTATKLASVSELSLPSLLPALCVSVYVRVSAYVCKFMCMVAPFDCRVLGFVIALGVPFNRHHALSLSEGRL